MVSKYPTTGRHLLLLLTLGIATVTGAAELVTLSPETYEAYRPRGKEADAIIGDYVLRNDRIVAAVADPTLLSGRSSQRWAIANVAGCLIDLTSRADGQDLLTAYYPAKLRFKPDAPNWAREFVDERLAHTLPGREPQHGERVTLSLPPYEYASGKMLQELETLPEHLRGAPKLSISVSYTLADGWDYIEVAVSYHNPTAQDEAITPFAALRVDGAGSHRSQADGAYLYDPHWRQAYGVVPVAHTLKAGQAPRRGGVRTELAVTWADAPQLVIPAGGQVTLTRRIYAAPTLQALLPDVAESTPAATAKLRIEVQDESGRFLPAKLAFVGIDGTPDPDFFPATGEHQVRNLVYTPARALEVAIPVGSYAVTVTRGPEYRVVRQRVTTQATTDATLRVALPRAYATPGWVAVDTHSHSTLSGASEVFYVYPYSKDPTADGDSLASTRGRVLNLLAEGIAFAPATEHNFIADYAPIVSELGGDGFLKTVPGIGLSSGRRHTVNHQNVWPVIPVPGRQDGGAIQRPEHVGQLPYMLEWYDSSAKLVEIVQPRGDALQPAPGMDVLNVVDLEPIVERKPLPSRDNRILDWLALLQKGYRLPATVSAGDWDNFHGSAALRTYVACDAATPAAIDPQAIREAMEQGRMILTTGPFMTVTLNGVGPGGQIEGATGLLQVALQTANDTVLDRLQVLVNGETVLDREATDGAYPLAFTEDGFVVVVASGRGPNLRGGDGETVTHVVLSNPIWVDVAGDGYTPHSPLADAVTAVLDFVEAPLAKPGAPPGRVRVHLKNTGAAPARDTVTLHIVPPEAARIVGPATQSYVLPHEGAEADVEWQLVFEPAYLRANFPMTSTYNNTGSFGVRTERSGVYPGRKGASEWMHVDYAALSLPPLEDLARLDEALESAVVYPVTSPRDGALGDLRFGVSGQHLAVLARVREAKLTRHAIVWEGSCVELFGSMPGRSVRNTEVYGGYFPIRQVYLAPAVGEAPAAAWRRVEQAIVPAPEIRVASRATRDGYELQALVPLALLGIDVDAIEREVYTTAGYTPVELLNLTPRAGRFLLEARMNTRRQAAGGLLRGTIFRTPAPHVDHLPFGRFRLESRADGALTVLRPLAAEPDGAPAQVRLTLTNTAAEPIDDTVTLTTEPADAVAILGEATVPVQLAPGATWSHDFTLRLRQDTLAAGVYLVAVRSPLGQIARIPSPLLPIADRELPRLPPTALPEVQARLADQPARPIRIADATLAEVRAAVTDAALIVDAIVRDEKLAQGARPWKGSCFEVFAAQSDQESIRQIFLLPADAAHPAAALVPEAGKQVPAPDIALQSHAVDGGYRLQAVIPLARLGLAPDAPRLRLEFQLSTTRDARMQYGTVFGSKRAYQDASHYGRYRIVQPAVPAPAPPK